MQMQPAIQDSRLAARNLREVQQQCNTKVRRNIEKLKIMIQNVEEELKENSEGTKNSGNEQLDSIKHGKE